MTEKPKDNDKKLPEPGSAEDSHLDRTPAGDPAEEIVEKGEPGDGNNFA